MDSRFRIFQNGRILSIYGLEQNGDEYAYEDGISSYRQYKYSESITLNAIYTVSSDEEETLVDYEFILHDNRLDQSNFNLMIDGLYDVVHIILPTKKYIESCQQNDDKSLEEYTALYYFDEESEKLMLFGTDTEVSIDNILEADDSTSVIKSSVYTFSVHNLKECVYNTYKKEIKNNWGKCIKRSNSTILRDINWMALYVIKYLIDLCQYYEAQRIYETILDCGTSCLTLNKNNDCGCS